MLLANCVSICVTMKVFYIIFVPTISNVRFTVRYWTFAASRLLHLLFTKYDYPWDNIGAELTADVLMCKRNHVYAKFNSIKSRDVFWSKCLCQLDVPHNTPMVFSFVLWLRLVRISSETMALFDTTNVQQI